MTERDLALGTTVSDLNPILESILDKMFAQQHPAFYSDGIRKADVLCSQSVSQSVSCQVNTENRSKNHRRTKNVLCGLV